VSLTLSQIVEAEEAGDDANAAKTLFEMYNRFAQAIGQVVNLLDPGVIVLGGGAGQVPGLKTWGAKFVRQHVFGPDFVTPIVAPELGDSAGVFGAAMLTGSNKD